jgi:hypothetical protein
MPTPNCETHDALANVQLMYRRVLTSWVLDVARLRRSGLHRPSRRKGSGMVAHAAEQTEVIAYRYPHAAATDMLNWRRRAA